MLSPLCITITIYVLVLLLSTTTDAFQLYQQQQQQPVLHQQHHQHQKYYHRDQYSTTTVMSAAAAAVVVPAGGEYDRSTVHADAYLLPKLQQAFGPNLKKYEILETIVQPNAVGFKLKLFPPPSLEPENDEDSNNTDTDATKTESAASSSSWPDEVFFKQVLATDYQSNRKDWSDLRRTLLVRMQLQIGDTVIMLCLFLRLLSIIRSSNNVDYYYHSRIISRHSHVLHCVLLFNPFCVCVRPFFISVC